MPILGHLRVLLLLAGLAGAALAQAQTTPSLQQQQPTPPTPSQFPSLAGQRIVFFGDSVTAAGQYVSIFEYYYARHRPTQPADIISLGVASETLSGLSEKAHLFPRPVLFERLDRALTATKPGIVFAMYGMNDGIYHPATPERFEAFTNGVTRLSEDIRRAGAKLVLITPPPFDDQAVTTKTLGDGASDYSYKQPYARYAAVLSEYSRWMLSLRDAGIPVVDVNGALSRGMARRRRTNPDFILSPDGIHPTKIGHLLIARNLMRVFEIPYDRTDAAQAIEMIEADPLYRMIDERRRARASGWTKYVGYVRGERVKSDNIAETEARAQADLAAIIEHLRIHPPAPIAPPRMTTATQIQSTATPATGNR